MLQFYHAFCIGRLKTYQNKYGTLSRKFLINWLAIMEIAKNEKLFNFNNHAAYDGMSTTA